MSKIYPKFLGNQPLGEDQFEGKSQDSMAGIIAGSVVSSIHNIIGIDGNWGSGKSNLVKIVEGKLKDKNYFFFIYDVWGHQEDEQRRTILEEITEYINSKNLVQKDKWEEKLKNLLAKNKETTTKKKPVLSLGIILSLVALLLIPFFKSFGDEIKSDWKYLVYLSPALILFFAYLYYFFKNFNSTENVYLIAGIKLFEIYSKDKIEETTYVTITEDEPSVKKFRDWILEIDKDLKENKVILVFDNFDRLPKDKILKLWSSIHIFFAEQKYKNIKVIIPFDREHIRNAFEDLNPKGNSSEFTNYAEDYINKTFDIVYRVAPPIMSNWKFFFEGKWRECLGENFKQDEFVRTVQVYELLNKKITPREIIVLINEIATLKLVHSDKIPAQYLALFVLNKDLILSDPIVEIVSPSYLRGLDFIYKKDENLPKYITAIVYQLDPDDSLEIIYSKELRDALMSKNTDSLMKISQANFFSKILETEYSKISNDYLPNVIEALNSLNDSAYENKNVEELIWEDIINNVGKELKNDTHEFQEYQGIIISRIKKDSDITEYCKSICKELAYEKDWDSMNYINNIDILDKFLKNKGINVDVLNILEDFTTDSVDDFLKILKDKKESYSKYKINVNSAELDLYLSKIGINDLENIEEIKNINIAKYGLPKFKNTLKSYLQQYYSNNTHLKNIISFLKIFGELVNTKDISDSELYSRFVSLTSNDDLYYDIIGIRLSRTLNLSGYQSYFQGVMNEVENNFVDKVAKKILNYIEYGNLLLKIDEFKDVPLYKEVIKKLTVSNYGKYRLGLNEVLPKFEDICFNTELEPDLFIKKLNDWDSAVVNVNTVNKLTPFFFETAVNNNNALANRCIDLKNDYFENFTNDNWIITFDKSNSKDFKILQIIEYKSWSSEALEALKYVFKEKSSKIIENVTEEHDIFNDLITSFEENGHKFKNTFDTIRDEFIKTGNMDNNRFQFYAEWLFRYSNLKSEGVVRTIFKIDLLKSSECIEIMKKNAKKLKTILLVNSEEAEDLKNAIVEKSEINSSIKELGNLLGFVKKQNSTDKK
ncbi:P-loop NTPase fold protein [Chryseobacterium taiwanense]|uniref:KAP NTPase domain-containing protein n=1 Tax=Chryseobacterium taiwanense TaxID=363331 RepID=A0A0B4DKF7_9FLAO|nr:P-loop NTPase fold protein [Chryseobacterium taiwanense]KIC64900.1 hypothetical protein RM51_00035 [Chryseobacterium taiwanense]